MPDRPHHPAEHSRGAAVLLEHTPTGDSPHLDLMLAPPGVFPVNGFDREARTLLTFRLPRDADPRRAVGTVHAVRLHPHRQHYLDFEGPMTNNRGLIRCLARGTSSWRALPDQTDSTALDIRVTLDDQPIRITAAYLGPAESLTPAPPLGAWTLEISHIDGDA